MIISNGSCNGFDPTCLRCHDNQHNDTA